MPPDLVELVTDPVTGPVLERLDRFLAGTLLDAPPDLTRRIHAQVHLQSRPAPMWRQSRMALVLATAALAIVLAGVGALLLRPPEGGVTPGGSVPASTVSPSPSPTEGASATPPAATGEPPIRYLDSATIPCGTVAADPGYRPPRRHPRLDPGISTPGGTGRRPGRDRAHGIGSHEPFSGA